MAKSSGAGLLQLSPALASVQLFEGYIWSVYGVNHPDEFIEAERQEHLMLNAPDRPVGTGWNRLNTRQLRARLHHQLRTIVRLAVHETGSPAYDRARFDEREFLRAYLGRVGVAAKIEASDLVTHDPALADLENPLTATAAALDYLWSELHTQKERVLPLSQLVVNYSLSVD